MSHRPVRSTRRARSRETPWPWPPGWRRCDCSATTPPTIGSKSLSARLAEGLDRAATDAGVPHVVQRVGSMLTLFFHDGPVHNYDDARRSDTRLFARFFWEMLARGVYLPCSQFEAAFVSAAHTEDDIDQTIAAAADAVRACRS